jgi:hypothetical protein
MNSYILYTLPYRAIELAAVIGVIFFVAQLCAKQSGAGIMRFIQHPHRLWFAAGIYFLPMIVGHLYAAWMNRFFSHSGNIPNFHVVASVALSLFYGIAYGLIGCLLAATGKVADRLSQRLAFGIAAGLVVLFTIVQSVFFSFSLARNFYLADILVTVVFVLILIARATTAPASESSGGGAAAEMAGSPTQDSLRSSPEHAFLWLLVGLAPIPMLLMLLPADGSGSPAIHPVVLLLGCVACNLSGGIGCLSNLKNVAVRIILGFLLAGFFFLLALAVVLFQACSHMHF